MFKFICTLALLASSTVFAAGNPGITAHPDQDSLVKYVQQRFAATTTFDTALLDKQWNCYAFSTGEDDWYVYSEYFNFNTVGSISVDDYYGYDWRMIDGKLVTNFLSSDSYYQYTAVSEGTEIFIEYTTPKYSTYPDSIAYPAGSATEYYHCNAE